MSEKIELTLAVCGDCGAPFMVIRGGYLRPEEIDALGLKLAADGHEFGQIIPEPGMRAYEFKDPAEAKVKYAEYLDGLEPGWEKAYAVLTRKSQVQN